MASLPESVSREPAPLQPARVRACGKFLFAGDQKLQVRGVTYGTFRPTADGQQFPEPEVVASDFAQMAAHGVNAVRTYTTPPGWLLDRAWENGLRVLVGLAAEREVGYLNDSRDLSAIEARFRDRVRSRSGHQAVLCYAIGNEIPAAIVRWFGKARIENLLAVLTRVVREVDPEALVTYVNYPSTEYLELPFVDVMGFNVYLESMSQYESYL